jgi:acetoin utilization protein AcuB
MQRHDVTHLPVLAKGRLVGLLSERDIQTVLPSPATSLSKWELHYLLDKLTVRHAMTADIMTVPPTTSLSEAVRLMMMHRIGALPVVENHRMVGLLTQDDILRIFLVDQAQPSFAA